MTEGYVIDWSIVAALFATSAAFIAAGVTYFSNKQRHDLDARLEICKYREKWLSEVKEEVAVFVSQAMLLGVETRKNKSVVKDLMTRRSRILLAVPTSNPHYKELNDCLGEIAINMMNTSSPDLGGNTGNLIRISKDILQDEWDEIQSLLYKKEK